MKLSAFMQFNLLISIKSLSILTVLEETEMQLINNIKILICLKIIKSTLLFVKNDNRGII